MKFWSGLAIAAAATLLSACNADMNFNASSSGVPLAELDYQGAKPTGIALAGPDNLIVTSGDTLTIEVEGDPEVTKDLRFDLDEDSLEIGREGNWRKSGVATIRITMPTPTEVSLAGSGKLEVDRLGTGGDAEVNIAGSGESRIATVDAAELEVNIAGSGSLEAAGSAKTLELSIAGSGDLDLRQLDVGDADVSIAGSGDAIFASDGQVEASIMGSGTVEVVGNATCTVSSVGSGELKCKARTATADAQDAKAAQDQSSGTDGEADTADTQ